MKTIRNLLVPAAAPAMIAAVIGFAGGCTPSTAPVTDPPGRTASTISDAQITGTYQYTGYDSNGVAIIDGELVFEGQDTTFLWGTKDFDGPEGYGPQIGRGDFTGWIDNRAIMLDLNPGWADNNVILHGEFVNGTYSGIWEVVTIIGPVYTGAFRAVKISGVPRPMLNEDR